MPARKPLVIVDGQIEQIQSGDTLDAVVAEQETIILTNDEASPIVIGTPVYIDAANGCKKSKADALGTAAIIGLVKDVSIGAGSPGDVVTSGLIVATTAQWNTVCGTVGLVPGSTYFLSDATVGKLTAVAPTSVGSFVIAVGVAISTTDLKIDVEPSILL